MLQNTNPETLIRYGIISANSLNSELVDELMYGCNAKDLSYEEAKLEFMADIEREVQWEIDEGKIEADEFVEEVETRFDFREQDFNDNYYCDEPTIEGEHDGVKYRTTWLGGALLVFFLESPYTLRGDLCSPCIPGAVNLDSPNPDGFEGYAPPSDWFAEESSDECSG